METEIIKEGELKLEVPKLENYKTSEKEYVPSKTPVFFNPIMELSRDISVSSVQVIGKSIDGLRICDVLTGIGARGLRYAKEVSGVKKVVVNDRSADAFEFIKKNIKHNQLSVAEAKREDANVLLYNHRPRFHIIDIDPFGTPIPFLEPSFTAISRRGALLITATDTAPLCGAYPNACKRKYGSTPLRTPYSRELGLRILVGSIQRKAAAFDLALIPLLSHATQHYFRIHFQVDQGARKANRILKDQGYLAHCFQCGKRTYKKGFFPNLPENCECGGKYKQAGPLYLEKMGDKEHIKALINDLSLRNFKLYGEERNLLETLAKENEGPPIFYDLHEVCSKSGASPPKINHAIQKLRKNGYFASRTHFLSNGIRTDATMESLTKLISE